jgi:hypothetical protein
MRCGQTITFDQPSGTVVSLVAFSYYVPDRQESATGFGANPIGIVGLATTTGKPDAAASKARFSATNFETRVSTRHLFKRRADVFRDKPVRT